MCVCAWKCTLHFVYLELENIQEDMGKHFNNWVVLAKLLDVVMLPANVGCIARCPKTKTNTHTSRLVFEMYSGFPGRAFSLTDSVCCSV